MTTRVRVAAWIGNLPDTFSWSPSQTRPVPATSHAHKRKAVQALSPPATVASMEEDAETPTRKRQRPVGNMDTELTPRPQYESWNDPIKAPSLASSSASGRTRSTSPLKRQFLELRLDDRGFETQALDADALEDLPNPEAASLLRTMNRISTCKGILPHNMRENVLKDHKVKESALEDWDSAFKDSSAFDGLPGRIPSAREIDLVRGWSKDCVNDKHEEAGWNDEVHFRLLQAIFREPWEKTGGLYNITTWQAAPPFIDVGYMLTNRDSNSARPHKAWLPRSTGSKMVDFCVYADANQQDAIGIETHKAFCRTTPTKSVNHTDFQRLQIHPIMLSIETKAENQSLDKAELQIGVWHAAQWKFLRSSLLAVQRASAVNLSFEQQMSEADEALSRLPFIPAVIVQGQRWYFVLSTPQGEKTLLWKEKLFGSTSTVVETYQVVAGLRQLIAWAQRVYMPWFQKEILSAYIPKP